MPLLAIRPGGTAYIDDEVKKWVLRKYGWVPQRLSPYKDAVRVLWPALDSKSALTIACEVFMQVAEEEKFVIDETYFQVAA